MSDISKEVVKKINDLIVIKEGFPKGSRGYEAVDWAIKNLTIAHDAYVMNSKPMVVDKHWESGI